MLLNLKFGLLVLLFFFSRHHARKVWTRNTFRLVMYTYDDPETSETHKTGVNGSVFFPILKI